MQRNDWPTDARVRWPNFTAGEMECKCGCGGVPEFKFMDALQRLRDRVKFAIPVTSGFRCDDYDKYARGAGVHPSGLAANLGVDKAKAYYVIKWAMHLGFTGIGDKGRGDNRFVHIDMISENEDTHHPRPRKWTY